MGCEGKTGRAAKSKIGKTDKGATMVKAAKRDVSSWWAVR